MDPLKLLSEPVQLLNISLQETNLKHSAKHENIGASILLREVTKFRVKPIKELSIIQIFPSLSLPGQMLQKTHHFIF